MRTYTEAVNGRKIEETEVCRWGSGNRIETGV